MIIKSVFALVIPLFIVSCNPSTTTRQESTQTAQAPPPSPAPVIVPHFNTGFKKKQIIGAVNCTADPLAVAVAGLILNEFSSRCGGASAHPATITAPASVHTTLSENLFIAFPLNCNVRPAFFPQVSAHGRIFLSLPATRCWLPAPLPPTPCSLYPRDNENRHYRPAAGRQIFALSHPHSCQR